MKKILGFCFIALVIILTAVACNQETKTPETTAADPALVQGQSAVKDDESAKDVVKIAAGSADHTTLVAAIKQAQLVDALSNAGPFTVFCPDQCGF